MARDTDVRPCVMRRVFVATRQAALVICCSSVLNWFDFATEGYVRCTGGTLFLIDVFWTHSLYNVARCAGVFAQCRRAGQLSSSCVVCVREKPDSVR